MGRKEGSVAILILNYNSKPFLENCLTSLFEQTHKDFEVFLIDNHSTDGSFELVKGKFPNVQIITNPKNYGFGRGFNEGIRQVYNNFEYIALLNPDIKANKKWLEESIITLKAHPKAQICSSFILDWEGKTVDVAGGRIINFLMGIFGGFLGGIPVEKIPPKYKNQDFRVFFGIATAIVTRAETLTKFGFFDESYFMYFEDIDLSWRVLLGKGEIWCSPKAVVYHYGHGAKKTKEIQLRIAGTSETNLLATYFKNLSLSTLIIVLPLLLFIRIVASFVYIPISPKITHNKLKGIVLFLVRLFLGKYTMQRKFTQKLRKLNDWQVLALNPGRLFSFGLSVKLIRPWTTRIKEVYEKSKMRE